MSPPGPHSRPARPGPSPVLPPRRDFGGVVAGVSVAAAVGLYWKPAWPSLREFGTVMAAGWAAPSWPLLRDLVIHQAGALLVFMAMVASIAGSGAAVVAWGGARALDRIRLPVTFFAGAGAGAAILVGWLLVRLWFPAVMVLAFVLPAALGWLVHRRRILWFPPAASWRWAPAIPVILVLPWLLTPEMQPDAWEYYFNGPDRWIRLHGFSVRGATPPLHYPFLAEMLYSLPLLCGREPVARWLNGAALVCGLTGAAVAFAVPVGSALLVALTSATSVYALTCAKNEGFSTGAILLALACGRLALARRERAGRFWSATMAGLAGSTKYLAGLNVAWVPVVLWWDDPQRAVRRWLAWGAVAAAVVSPWLVKTWLMTGDPVYPILSGLHPAIISGWDDRNARVWRLCSSIDMPPSPLLEKVGLGVLGEHVLLAAVLPWVLVRSGALRPVVVASLATYAVWFAAFWSPQTARWGFSAIGILLVLAAGEWDRWMKAGGLARIAAIAGLAVGGAVSLSRLGQYPNPVPYLLGAESRAHYTARYLTNFTEVHAALKASASPRGILLVGEVREFGLPRPCLVATAHASGEAPLIWRLVNESGSLRELEVKFRQLNADRLVYNFVTIKLVQPAFVPFRWDDRMLRLYTEFCGRHLRLAGQTATCNFRTGGFCWYTLDPRRDIGDGASTYFLPGAEAFMQDAMPLRRAGKTAEALEVFGRLAAAHPRVGSFRSELGYAYALLGDQGRAYRELATTVRAGVRDSINMPTWGLAAYSLGRYEEAGPILERVLEWYPDYAHPVRTALGGVHVARAVAAVTARKIPLAERELGEAEQLLQFTSLEQGGRIETMRRESLAKVYGLRGDLAQGAGRIQEAAGHYRTAFRTAPDLAGAQAWSDAAQRLDGSPAAGGPVR